jgi:hypothetical protein
MFEISIQGLEKAPMFEELNWKNEVEIWMVVATELSLEHLKQTAIANMRSGFQTFTGALAGEFIRPIDSYHFPVTGRLINPSPYAWRREAGFSGMTDSLGRHYTNDPGIRYMGSAFDSEQQWIKNKYKWALTKAVEELSLQHYGLR